MTIWIDAQVSPAIADWMSVNFAVDAAAIRDLGLRDATDTLPKALELLKSGEKIVEINAR